MKTVSVLVLALLLFTNYSTFINCSQGITHGLTQRVLSLASGEKMPTNGATCSGSNSIEADTAGATESSRSTMKDTLWNMFVNRPYMYMQYGTHHIDEIGKKRVENLLKKETGEDRYQYVLEKEIKEKNNEFMVTSSIADRIAFTPVYLFTNGLVSIPIFILCIVLIVLQFWFIIMAALAPFALVIAAIPGFFGVIKRYSIELMIPLFLKVFFAFFTVLILGLSTILYETRLPVSFGSASGIVDFVFMAVFQFVLFITIFLLRKRIANIFSSGSQIISGLRDASGSVNPIDYAKKGVAATAVVAGTAVGAVAGGPQGAVMGASIGSSVGKVATGEGSASDAIQQGARAYNRQQTLSKLGQQNSGAELPGMNEENKAGVIGFMKDKGFDDEMAQQTTDSLEKNGLHDATPQEIESQYDKIGEDLKNGKQLEKDVPTTLAEGIKQDRLQAKKEQQEEVIKNSIPVETKTPNDTLTNAAPVLMAHGANEKLGAVMERFDEEGMHDVSKAEMESQFARMKEQHGQKGLNGKFEDEFVKGIKHERINDSKAREQRMTEQDNNKLFGEKMYQTPAGPERIETGNELPLSFNGVNEPMPNEVASLDPTSLSSSTIESKSSNGNGINGTPLNGNVIGNSSLEQEPLSGNDVGGTPIGGGKIDTKTIDSSSINPNEVIPNAEKETLTKIRNQFARESYEQNGKGWNEHTKIPKQESDGEHL